MSSNETTLFEWESLDNEICLLPTELLAYYLYRYRLDVKNKKTNFIDEDMAKIYEYALKLGKIGGGTGVSKTDNR